ncbi:MAG: glycoside hydrolase family 3 N-terminal domain-containing protein, partial [Gemmatimonadota bacterium]
GRAAAVPTDRLLPLDRDARRWVDSVLASLGTRQRAAQLVVPWMWGRYVPMGSDSWERLRVWVEDAGVGGIITSIGPPVALADKLNRLQRLADVPLLIVTDMEHGPGQRLDGGTLLPYGVDLGGGTEFPPAMALGATGDPSLAYAMGRVTAAEARAVGIHVNFAPVVDVNNNPANPIINVRSYGSDPSAVAGFAVAQLRGLQDHGMLATAKHFPGHGDVRHDTHLVPLILRIDAARADSVELVPYRAAIAAGVSGVMSAHIAFPALAGDSTLPATLSPRMLDSLLVGELGFDGLVITDALNMGAIVRRFGPTEAAVLALEAGADILLQPVDPLVMIDAVSAAVESGRIPSARLERSVRKLLEAKARVGLHRRRTVDVERVAEVVGAPAHRRLAAGIAARSLTLARDRDDLVPLVPLRDRRVLLVSYTDTEDPFAGHALARTLGPELVGLHSVALGPEPPPAASLDELVALAEDVDLVILAIDARVRGGAAAALDSATARAFRRVAAARRTVLVSLQSPYLLQELPEVGTYLLGWSAAEVAQEAVGRALLGLAPITGRLPTAVPPMLPRGAGIGRAAVPGAGLDATPPPLGGIDQTALDSIRGAIEAAIEAGVTPGAVVAVGRSGGPAWVEAIGRTDREPGAPAVADSTMYDLASLTKVVGTTSAVMALVDEGRMALDAPLSRYLPGWPAGGWRDQVTIRRLLTHSAGLAPFVRFWHPSEGALRGRDATVDAIAARDPAYTPGTRVRYSDLGAILLGAAVEAVVDTTLDAYLDERLWTPLGMHDTRFTPLSGPAPVRLARIAPTELDTVFRETHVHGEVHDENAWAMGGVAGHAGLFSTAPDLARFARMLLRAGRADTARIVGPAAVARFTGQADHGAAATADAPGGAAVEGAGGGLERALGWDLARGTAIAEAFSPTAFGHTGFTGTSLWIDPQRDLYVVLLTNRVNPTREQGGIRALRRAVHELAVRGTREP